MADANGVQSPCRMGAGMVLGVTPYQVWVHGRRPIVRRRTGLIEVLPESLWTLALSARRV